MENSVAVSTSSSPRYSGSGRSANSRPALQQGRRPTLRSGAVHQKLPVPAQRSPCCLPLWQLSRCAKLSSCRCSVHRRHAIALHIQEHHEQAEAGCVPLARCWMQVVKSGAPRASVASLMKQDGGHIRLAASRLMSLGGGTGTYYAASAAAQGSAHVQSNSATPADVQRDRPKLFLSAEAEWRQRVMHQSRTSRRGLCADLHAEPPTTPPPPPHHRQLRPDAALLMQAWQVVWQSEDQSVECIRTRCCNKMKDQLATRDSDRWAVLARWTAFWCRGR